MRNSFNYGKLRGRIIERYGTYAKYAAALKTSSATLSSKLNNHSEFSQSDIIKSMPLLAINAEDICDFYFCSRV